MPNKHTHNVLTNKRHSLDDVSSTESYPRHGACKVCSFLEKQTFETNYKPLSKLSFIDDGKIASDYVSDYVIHAHFRRLKLCGGDVVQHAELFIQRIRAQFVVESCFSDQLLGKVL